ncbi:transposable element Tcb2 transposase [Trichonephila clavipes]|nr:transposable element Tcb2 transposase [Trichonephila clavipes]
MSSHNSLDDDLRWRAIGWIEAGMSRAEVARNLNVSQMMIFKLWKQFQIICTVVRRPGKGRSTPTEGRYFPTNALRHIDMAAKFLAQNFVDAPGKTIPIQTVSRHLAVKALYNRWAVVCVPLNP